MYSHQTHKIGNMNHYQYPNQLIQYKDYQLKNYQNYGIEMGLDVFLALGVGGSPSKPEELFVFPLKNLKENTISFEQLVNYRKKTDKNFFYDMSTKVLR